MAAGIRDKQEISLEPLQRGILFGLFAFVIYLLIVIITTPALKPSDAVVAAVRVNWWVMLLLSIGIGAQSYLLAYAKQTACRIKHKGIVNGTSRAAVVVSSFTSFFSLIAVGCCGTWLYVLSILPGVVGVGASAILISYSGPIIVIGFTLMALSIIYTYLSIKPTFKR